MRRKTHDEYVEDLQKVNPHLHIQDKYVNNRTKIIIEDDRCGHIWNVMPSTPLRGVGCPYCSNRHKRTYEEFTGELCSISPNIVVITPKEEYVNGSTKVLCMCRIDNHEWLATPSSLLQGRGCPKCYGYITEPEFIERLKKVNPSIALRGKYLGSKTSTKFRCLLDGHIWTTQPYHILNGSGCPMCANKRQSDRQTLTHSEYLKRLTDVTNSITPVEKYKGGDTKVLHRCSRCGYEWSVSPYALISERTGCPKCNSTKGENRIIKFLEDNDIKYEFQKKFDDLKNINQLAYDFYIPSLNILIEYDGEFHYQNIFNNDNFEMSKIRDNLKNEYAQNNNIKLIRIPYWDFDKIENILQTQLLA